MIGRSIHSYNCRSASGSRRASTDEKITFARESRGRGANKPLPLFPVILYLIRIEAEMYFFSYLYSDFIPYLGRG